MHDDRTPELESELADFRRHEAEDRARDKAPVSPFANVTPIVAARSAAPPAPRDLRIRSSEERIAELSYIAPTMRELELRHGLTPPPAPAPRLVVAGDVVAELERQHRRAYHRRQEQAARRRRRRQAFLYGRDLLGLAFVAGLAAVALFVLAIELNGSGH